MAVSLFEAEGAVAIARRVRQQLRRKLAEADV